MKKGLNILYLPIILFLGTSCGNLLDLRNEKLRKESDYPKDPLAMKILGESMGAYGGFETWRSIKRTKLTYEDSWFGVVGSVFKPWPKSPQRINHSFWNGSFDSKLEFIDGAFNGQSWERRDSKSYKNINGTSHEVDYFNIEFFLVTYQYLVELPYRINEIPIIKYYGDTTLMDQSYDLIFGTWKSLEPTEEFDQYILWINKETKLIDYFHYTVRVFGNGIKGTVNYDDFREIDGIVVPFKQTITPLPGKGSVLHQIKIESVALEYRDRQSD